MTLGVENRDRSRCHGDVPGSFEELKTPDVDDPDFRLQGTLTKCMDSKVCSCIPASCYLLAMVVSLKELGNKVTSDATNSLNVFLVHLVTTIGIQSNKMALAEVRRAIHDYCYYSK